MHRKIFTVLILLASLNIAQSVKAIKFEKLVSGDMERLYFPRFSPDGNSIALTKSNFKGLWLFDLQKKELTQINDYYGSGYNPEFTGGDKIHFKIDNYKNKRRSPVAKFYSLSAQSEFDDTLKSSISIHVKSGKTGIVLYENGKSKILKPFGDGNYIWVSLSPDKENILFTSAGKGTYICELDGRIITDLGYANAARWSPDGRWITYMNDKDDGLKYTSSDIFVVTADGKTKFNLTNSNSEVEMYPEWSPDGKKIVYQNLSGEIFITELDIQ